VLHRDLKPENLLLESAADDAKVKIADFGASKLVISCGAKTPCGSLGYAAPEQLRGLKFAQDPAHVPPYDKEVDIWSVGVITYILLSGSMPFDPASYSVESISRSGSLEFPSSLFGEVSAEALDFIRSLLQVDPAKRLTAASALRHPWVVAELEEAPKSASKRAGRWGAGLLSAGASSSLPTPSTDAKQPTSALRSTPLPTPRRLKMLQESGQLRSNWDRATKPAAAHDGDENREGAQKRTAVELENDEKRGADEDVPLVMLPEEVTKKIRRYSSDSSHLSSQASNESARSARVAGGDSAASQQ
jgi:serine/threonine protein kinase